MNQGIKCYQLQSGQLVDVRQYLQLFKDKEVKLPVFVAKFVVKIKKPLR